MRTFWNRMMDLEPARVYLAVRSVAYILVGLTGSWLSPDHVEPIIAALAILLGVDVGTTEGTRSRVTPVRKRGGPQR